MEKQKSVVNGLIKIMRGIINKHNLELLKTYPNDLLVHDRAFLEIHAVPGATIAWMVGDRHTHIVPLGIEQQQNEMVHCLTNLSNNDRFYLIKVLSINGVTFEEMDREQFKTLASTPIRYSMSGSNNEGFTLMHGENKVGYVSIERRGINEERKFIATVTPNAGITKLDIAALDFWAGHAITKVAQTLFCKSEILWNEPAPQKRVA